MTNEPGQPHRVWVSPGVGQIVSRHLVRYPDATLGEVLTIVRAHLPGVPVEQVRAAVAAHRGDEEN